MATTDYSLIISSSTRIMNHVKKRKSFENGFMRAPVHKNPIESLMDVVDRMIHTMSKHSDIFSRWGCLCVYVCIMPHLLYYISG